MSNVTIFRNDMIGKCKRPYILMFLKGFGCQPSFESVGTVGVSFCTSAWLPNILLGAAEAPLTDLLWVIVIRMVWPRLPPGHSLKEWLHNYTKAKTLKPKLLEPV